MVFFPSQRTFSKEKEKEEKVLKSAQSTVRI